MKLAANVFQDKQQSMSDMGNFSNLANLAYNKAIQTESNYENLSNLMKKIAEMTIANENNLNKFNDILEDTRNIAIEAKNVSTTNNMNGIINQQSFMPSKLDPPQPILSNQYAKIFSEILEAKNIALEAKQTVSEQKKTIDISLRNLDSKFNTNLEKFNKELTNITLVADTASNNANSILETINETQQILNKQIENIPKIVKPKLYGNLQILLSNPDFNGQMSENSVYQIYSDTDIVKIENNLIFKSITKYQISEIKKIISVDYNYDYDRIRFFNYYILEEPINYITDFGLYIIAKNSDLVKFSHNIKIHNYIQTQTYLISNKLLHDSFIEINNQIYMCGPYCNISNYDIYESNQNDVVLEIYVNSEINNIQLDTNSDKYFCVKKVDSKYYLILKQNLQINTFNLDNLNKVKLVLYVTDQNDIPFPRLFYLNIRPSIKSFVEIINIDNKSLKSIFTDYYNQIKIRALTFNDFYNLIQIILPTNCQTIKILNKIKQNLTTNNIYINSSRPEIKENLLKLIQLIDSLTNVQSSITKNSTIDDYDLFVKSIDNLNICAHTLSPEYISKIIISLSDKYVANLIELFKIIRSYLIITRLQSEQYNVNKFSEFVQKIYPVLTEIKETQINLTTELSIFDGF
jgi:hypothetical protein